MKESHPKTLIFVHDLASLIKIRDSILLSCRKNAYAGTETRQGNCFLSVYYSEMTEEDKHFVEEEFSKENSSIRILICTVAFGLGVNIPDVRLVFHLNE